MKYEIFKKKYPQVPSLAWLDKNFEVKEKSLEEIIKAVDNKLKKIADYFEAIILGDSYKTFVERSFLSEKDKEIISKIYREIQVLLNEEFLFDVKNEEKSKAEWLKNVKIFWEKNKENIVKIIEKTIEGWKKRKERIEKRETRYHW